jgi:transcriptional regulator with XRE-family HTH domain
MLMAVKPKRRFDYSKLRGRIVEKYGSISAFAKATNVSFVTASNRLNNKTEWKSSDIMEAAEVLDIALDDVRDYFFTPKQRSARREARGLHLQKE